MIACVWLLLCVQTIRITCSIENYRPIEGELASVVTTTRSEIQKIPYYTGHIDILTIITTGLKCSDSC